MNILAYFSSPYGFYLVGVVLVALCLLLTVTMYIRYIQYLALMPNVSKLKNLKDEIAEGQRTKAQLDNDIQTQKSEILSNQHLLDEVARAKQWLTDNNLTIQDLDAEIERKKAEHDKVKDALAEIVEKKQALDTEFQKVSGQHAGLKSDVERLQKEQNELSRAIDQSKLEIDVLNKRGVFLRQNVQDLEATLADLQEQRKQLEKSIEELKSQFDSLLKRSKELENDCIEKSKEVAALAGREASLRNSLKSSEDQLDRLLQREISLGGGDESVRFADLERPILKVTQTSDKAAAAPTNEMLWLDEFRNNLKKSGLVFNERTINSFHTGLKINDYSPLVVLAGISGTGKSLLPSLYAQAIGMHFMSVAVQPRWDSPQDLFGFYNYMEHRFKATELSRLLWQMDRYNNSNGDKAIHDSMALVLLDEMNLARVEYYFSDMLSKLESRRGLNPDDGHARRQAEVEIECGALKDAKAARRLFIGSNILFVGTMNEDESTQSLSDKVIDRSNVIRFGKPSKLDAHPEIDGFRKNTTVKKLSFKTWSTWRNGELGSQQAKELEAKLSPINDALAGVGRPFAHRVWQSIQQYVANYPDAQKQPKCFNAAIADQIEMKILPKLNGLELNTPQSSALLNKMRSVIGTLNDADLQDAFQKATDSNAAFFQWRGVTR